MERVYLHSSGRKSARVSWYASQGKLSIQVISNVFWREEQHENNHCDGLLRAASHARSGCHQPTGKDKGLQRRRGKKRTEGRSAQGICQGMRLRRNQGKAGCRGEAGKEGGTPRVSARRYRSRQAVCDFYR